MPTGIYLTEGPVRRSQVSGNPLLRKIQRACRMSLPEPDLALNLDVADYINEKQGAAPRDAVFAIVKLINCHDTHTAVFALALLDVLVKNCGYPVHLQISRKEFLNELVKRFPERPPMRYSKVQRLILTAIEEWYQTICKTASYKDDLGYIRDMHRLLKYKGYAFPKIQDEHLAVMRPNDQLKTASEIQKEQEIAQAAKLEELIRRGRPEDLREANKLMKVMAGFKEDNIIQAKQTINHELNKLRRKADLLNEMLSQEQPDLSSETMEELYSALKVAQPKFQKIIEEEHEDDTLVQSLLKFNDTVNQLLEKYNLLKIGNKQAAAAINPENISEVPAGSNAGALANEINLIDFDDEPARDSSNDQQGVSNGNNTSLDDLFGDLTLGQADTNNSNNQSLVGGGISLGAGKPSVATTGASVGLSNDSSDLLDSVLASPPPSLVQASNTPASTNISAADDLLGDFVSSPSPVANTSASQKLSLFKSGDIEIELDLARESDSTLKLKVFFNNLTFQTINNLVFSIATPKSVQLRLEPQSGNLLLANSKGGITQNAWIDNAPTTLTKPLKLKWKVSYTYNSTNKEETAVYTLPKI
ncbi:ADP-ribosylation factor-binding protein GGA2 [Nakaseomyces glabratus]|uniref:ADP-ribosylation factor-binding protein GGA2 n=1 Tax=Candida glabrata TaxID=5478 RepID=A0A0W0C940_CANGB|nr:VHS domain profile [Nakaseomyces glabratus]KAH7609742.1 VHS domain profile [Nakaseomyces glabratus]KAH7615450.1 VHS domain profile [Nakaseomyces glabratus]KTA96018.1 ADP-ribosylation factor-binding protein GGA2 [Nakaseomyces glabratus]KTA99131.1 ADP-ribosylation factor-binding protein GGA2 [Nakaseomyces glabratus]